MYEGFLDQMLVQIFPGLPYLQTVHVYFEILLHQPVKLRIEQNWVILFLYLNLVKKNSATKVAGSETDMNGLVRAAKSI